MTSNTPTSKRLPVMVIARLRAVGQRMQAKKNSVPLEGLASNRPLIGPNQTSGLAGGYDF